MGGLRWGDRNRPGGSSAGSVANFPWIAVRSRIRYITGVSEEQSVSHSTKTAVEKVLRDRLGQAGFSSADSRADRDSDGLFGQADQFEDHLLSFDRDAQGVYPLGETRFPHVRHHFDEQQKIVS